MDAADLLLTEVRELVRARGIDPLKDASDLEQLITEAEEDYLRRSDAGLVPPLIDPPGARSHVLDSMAGLGPLQSYLDDESIEEIWVNAPGRVFVARSGRPELTTTILESEDLTVLVERMLRASGRRLDLSSPSSTPSWPGDSAFTSSFRPSPLSTGRSTSASTPPGPHAPATSCAWAH